MACRIIRVNGYRQSWKECVECGTFICSQCGGHTSSIKHESSVTAICFDCDSENREHARQSILDYVLNPYTTNPYAEIIVPGPKKEDGDND